jgi:hypothetical protein
MPDVGAHLNTAPVPVGPEVARAAGEAVARFTLPPVGNQALANAFSRGPAAVAPSVTAQGEGGRCACGGVILPGGECSKCLARRMQAEGAPEDQIRRTVLARTALAEAGRPKCADPVACAEDDRRLARAMAEAGRSRGHDAGVTLTAAGQRTAARGPLDWIEERVEDAGEWVADRAEDVGEAVGDAAEWVGDRAEDVGEAVGDAAEWVGERAADAGEAVGDAAEWVGEQVAGASEWVRERAEELNPFGGGGPRTARKIRAQAICKCVGDDKCGGGKIHKKYFHVEDCREAKREAENICNNDPEMKEKCIRPKCYYRHGDYKCPA